MKTEINKCTNKLIKIKHYCKSIEKMSVNKLKELFESNYMKNTVFNHFITNHQTITVSIHFFLEILTRILIINIYFPIPK